MMMGFSMCCFPHISGDISFVVSPLNVTDVWGRGRTGFSSLASMQISEFNL
jgi:hypothetical protein